MASRNGLNPKLRGSKGRGFNRALPAPFGFDKGLKPNGTSMYFTVPGFVGKYINTPIAFELWTKISSTYNYSWAAMKFNYSSYNMRFAVDARGGAAVQGVLGQGTEFINGLNHVVAWFDPISGDIGSISNANASGYKVRLNNESVLQFSQYPVSLLHVNTDVSTTETNPFPMDEFRIYNRILSFSEVTTNYNNGFGANPCTTENLLVWYKFEKFEMLDFSPLQDGSEFQLGMRDHSGNNNHGLPINMDTNPSSPTYVLQLF